MTDKYYARFYVKHQDASDSYLRKAYTNLDLHTDGTYVKEKTDWLIMTKMEEQGVSGGESVILHLDDWEHLDELSKNPVGNKTLLGDHQRVKMLNIKLNILFLKKIKMENQLFLILINFQNLKIWNKVYFYKDFLTVLEESKNKMSFPLPVGSTIFSNNYFWLHGRKAF